MFLFHVYFIDCELLKRKIRFILRRIFFLPVSLHACGEKLVMLNVFEHVAAVGYTKLAVRGIK